MSSPPPPARELRWPLLLALTAALLAGAWVATPARLVVARLGLVGGEVWRHPDRCRANLATAAAGEEALPPVTRAILRMLRRDGIDRYALSPGLARLSTSYQRTVEGAWPRRCERDAPVLFMTLAEAAELPAEVPREVSDGMVMVRRD